MNLMRILSLASLPLAIVLLLAATLLPGCQSTQSSIPKTATKAEGDLITNDGTAELFVIFEPPDKFRIIASHMMVNGRILDIGGNGDIIWYKTADSEIVMKGKVILKSAAPFSPRPLTFVPPKGLPQPK